MGRCMKCGGSAKKGGVVPTKKMQSGGPNNLEKKIGRLENKKERLENRASRARSISNKFQGDPETVSGAIDNALSRRAVKVKGRVGIKKSSINRKINELKSSNTLSSASSSPNMKTMQKGGTAGVVGMPKYGNNPRTSDGNMLKKGGSISKPKMAKGGATKFGMLSVKAGVDKNPRATAADRIAGAKMRKKK